MVRPIDLQLAQQIENLAGAGVHLLDDVAVQAALGTTPERLAGAEHDVRHGVGHVEEEGAAPRGAG